MRNLTPIYIGHVDTNTMMFESEIEISRPFPAYQITFLNEKYLRVAPFAYIKESEYQKLFEL